jgi:hypothetical protein
MKKSLARFVPAGLLKDLIPERRRTATILIFLKGGQPGKAPPVSTLNP